MKTQEITCSIFLLVVLLASFPILAHENHHEGYEVAPEVHEQIMLQMQEKRGPHIRQRQRQNPGSNKPKELPSISDFLSKFSSPGEVDPQLLEAKALALAILEKALQNPVILGDSSYTRLYHKSIRELSNADIYLGDNGCGTSTLAWVNMGDDFIQACRLILGYPTQGKAQILIHEAIHLAGEGDECETTTGEVTAMNAASLKAFKNAYVSQCGIDHLYPREPISTKEFENFASFFDW